MTDLARRRFIAGAGLIAGGTVLPVAPAVASTTPLRLRMAFAPPRILELPYRAAERFAADIAQASEGSNEGPLLIGLAGLRRRETVAEDDEASPQPAQASTEEMDEAEGAGQDPSSRIRRVSPMPYADEDLLVAVGRGDIDMAYLTLDSHIEREPALAFAAGGPFGLNARQHQAWWHDGGGSELIDLALERHGCIALPCGAIGMPMGGFYPRAIQNPEDLAGLRVRVSGIGARVLRRMGADIDDTPPEDLADALRDGRIDAAAFHGPVDDEILDLHRLTRFYYAPAFWHGTANYYVLINRALWDDLSPARRKLISIAAQAAHQRLLASYDHLAAPALRRLAIAGVEMRYFPQAVMQSGLAAAEFVYDDLARRDALFAETLRSMRDYRTDALLSWPVAELSFDSFMARSRGEP
jgi:TRAP-type mannitol/chloroaromatic compound transport system substrate-binding protein